MTEEHGLESLRLVGLVLEFSNVGRGLTVFWQLSSSGSGS